MESFNRRKFIKTLLLGAGAFYIPTFPLFSRILDENDVIKNAFNSVQKKEALDYFYRREYSRAESAYKELIRAYPKDVSCYDGLAKVYAKNYKQIEIIELYQKGVDLNKDSPVFYDRLGRALNALSLGNLKYEQSYIQSTGDDFLIQSSALLYLKAIDLAPDKRYLREGLLDTLKCLDKKNKDLERREKSRLQLDGQIQIMVEEKIVAYRRDWLQSRKPKKNNLNHLEETRLYELIEKVEKTDRRKLYFDDEQQCRHEGIQSITKKYYYPLLYNAIAKKEPELAKERYERLKECDLKDSHSKGQIIKYFKKSGSYQKLIEFYNSESVSLQSFWTKAGLIQATLNKNKKDGNLELFKDIIESLHNLADENEIHSAKKYGFIYGGLAEGHFRLKEYDKGRKELLNAFDYIIDGGVAKSLIIRYAESYMMESKDKTTQGILYNLLGQNKSGISISDPILAIITKGKEYTIEKEKNSLRNPKQRVRASSRSVNSNYTADDLKVFYSLAKCYEQTNNKPELLNTLSAIESINSNDAFAKNRR